MSGTGKETALITYLVNYQPARWQVGFNVGESEYRQTTTIDNIQQSLIQLFQCLQKAEDNVRLFAPTAANKYAIDIDVRTPREHYKILMPNATSLFQQFTFSMETQNAYTEGGFCQLVQNCGTLEHDIWLPIGGLQNDANGTQDACFNRINRINDIIRLFKRGKDYWKTTITDWAAH
jgi:hypothetical protein